jgi:two-component system chemotaxis response regulator CheV
MPAMDGHSLTKRIKEDPVLRQLPVILFSSLNHRKPATQGHRRGR